jgi:hypothetical protein
MVLGVVEQPASRTAAAAAAEDAIFMLMLGF